MDGGLTCILSFGLACGGPVVVDVPKTPSVVVAEPEMETPDTGAQSFPEGSASAVLARVQAFYDGGKDLSATFRQTYVHPVYGTKTTSTGKLKVKKPGMMIWDYDKKSDQDFYADADTLWSVEHETRQVVTASVKNSDFAGAIAFLFGGRKLVEEFLVRHATDTLSQRYARAGHKVIELKPKQTSAHFKRLVLVVDDASGRVDTFVIRNADDSTNQFDLSAVATNVGLDAAAFKFKVPPGYVVIRE